MKRASVVAQQLPLVVAVVQIHLSGLSSNSVNLSIEIRLLILKGPKCVCVCVFSISRERLMDEVCDFPEN